MSKHEMLAHVINYSGNEFRSGRIGDAGVKINHKSTFIDPMCTKAWSGKKLLQLQIS